MIGRLWLAFRLGWQRELRGRQREQATELGDLALAVVGVEEVGDHQGGVVLEGDGVGGLPVR